VEAARAAWTPQIPLAVQFPDGLQLVGLSISPRPLKPGAAMQVESFWRCPPGRQSGPEAAFVHFSRDGVRFQADHPLDFEELAEQLDPWIFVLRTEATVPDGIPAGAYRLEVGVYRPETGRRLPPRTALEVRRKAALIPNPIPVN
jgi:hypothetical protein